MVDTVKTRRTHYEVLGLTPAATGDEIERAFAREMGGFRPHSIGGLAEVSARPRDPARSRQARGLRCLARPSARSPSRNCWHGRGVGHASFSGSALVARQQPTAPPSPVEPPAASPVAEPAAANPPPPEPSANPFDRPEPPAEATPFIAAALRELARPEPLARGRSRAMAAARAAASSARARTHGRRGSRLPSRPGRAAGRGRGSAYPMEADRDRRGRSGRRGRARGRLGRIGIQAMASRRSPRSTSRFHRQRRSRSPIPRRRLRLRRWRTRSRHSRSAHPSPSLGPRARGRRRGSPSSSAKYPSFPNPSQVRWKPS